MGKFLFSLVSVFTFNLAQAESDVDRFLKQSSPRFENFFQNVHQNPELGFREVETSKKFASHLRELGFAVTEGLGKVDGFSEQADVAEFKSTGVVGILQNGAGPTIWLRADMDGLPIQEMTTLSYKSLNGIMHACGHDFHMTSVLASAAFLSQSRDRWRGTLVILGQPAEELGLGAISLMRDGLYTRFPRPDFLLALHSAGNQPGGVIRVRAGNVLAGNDSIDITFHGRGGHGSAPHLTVDPQDIFNDFQNMVYKLVAREREAIRPLVVTFGKVEGGTVRNVIADQLKISGIIRTFDPETRSKVLRRIEQVAQATAVMHEAPQPPTVTFSAHLEPVINPTILHDHLRPVFVEAVGSDRVVTNDPIMGSEDFGELCEGNSIQCLFWFVGTMDANNPETHFVNHSSRHRIHFQPAFETAVKSMTAAVIKLSN